MMPDVVSPPPGRGGASAPAALRLSVLREARPLSDEGVLRVGHSGEPPLPHRPRLHHHRLQRESTSPNTSCSLLTRRDTTLSEL